MNRERPNRNYSSEQEKKRSFALREVLTEGRTIRLLRKEEEGTKSCKTCDAEDIASLNSFMDNMTRHLYTIGNLGPLTLIKKITLQTEVRCAPIL